MSASQSQRDHRPEQTPTPIIKRHRGLASRQTIVDLPEVTQAEHDCQFNSGNNVISCFPTSDTVVPQDEWVTFVWNSRRPQITQTNLVDIFLFRADSQQQILHFANQSNPTDQAGFVRAQVNDTWFGTDGLNYSGSNASYPFYWVLIRSDNTLDGNQVPQPIFTAVQTTVLNSVAAASSSSAAAASSSSAREASLSHTSVTGTTSPTGNVQRSSSSSSSFPHWAIAVIVVLGFLAIAASCILVFLILRRIRRRRDNDSHRNSMGSASPMIARSNQDMIQRYDSPPLPPHTGIPIATAASPSITTKNPTTDAASTISDGGGGLSTADAAIIADAFRKTLRKPDFAGPSADEGDSPDTTAEREAEEAVLSRALAEEGRDIRSVSSSRGVKVESQQSRLEPGDGS